VPRPVITRLTPPRRESQEDATRSHKESRPAVARFTGPSRRESQEATKPPKEPQSVAIQSIEPPSKEPWRLKPPKGPQPAVTEPPQRERQKAITRSPKMPRPVVTRLTEPPQKETQEDAARSPREPQPAVAQFTGPPRREPQEATKPPKERQHVALGLVQQRSEGPYDNPHAANVSPHINFPSQLPQTKQKRSQPETSKLRRLLRLGH